AWLPRDWNQPENLLSAEGLTQLRTLLTREPASAPQGRAPRVARVAAVLATLTQPDRPHAGWWARFRQWLREALAPPPQRADPGWLRRMIADSAVSQAVLEGILWGAPARARTGHELTRAARLRGESDRERLSELAAACERVRFSGREPAPQALAVALARGRELLAALEAPDRSAQGAR